MEKNLEIVLTNRWFTMTKLQDIQALRSTEQDSGHWVLDERYSFHHPYLLRDHLPKICICSLCSLHSNVWAVRASACPHSGELQTQKLKSHLLRTEFKCPPLKPWVSQWITTHATLTARVFFCANFYPSSPFTCIFSKTSVLSFSCVSCG